MAEEAQPDVATWSEIQVTAIFTLVTTAAFLAVFEFSRRNPAVCAVFDRRRSTKPNRTPPPLIRSRYFEWLFLSTDPAYSEYAEMCHAGEVIKERRRQQRRRERRREAGHGGGRGVVGVDDGAAAARAVGAGSLSSSQELAVIEEEEDQPERTKPISKGRQYHATANRPLRQSSLQSQNGSNRRNDDTCNGGGGTTKKKSARFHPSVVQGMERDEPPLSLTQQQQTSSRSILDLDDDVVQDCASSSSSSSSSVEEEEERDVEMGRPRDADDEEDVDHSNNEDDDNSDNVFDGVEEEEEEAEDERRDRSFTATTTTLPPLPPTDSDGFPLLAPSSDNSADGLSLDAAERGSHADDDGDCSKRRPAQSRSSPPPQISSVHSESEDGVELCVVPPSTTFPPPTALRRKHRRHRSSISRPVSILTPDVVEVHGRRLPASIAQWAISGDLTDDQLDMYERQLIERERDEERKFRERQRELKLAASAANKHNSGGGGGGGGGVKFKPWGSNSRGGSSQTLSDPSVDGGRSRGDDGGDDDDNDDDVFLDQDEESGTLGAVALSAPSRLGYLGIRKEGGRLGIFGRLLFGDKHKNNVTGRSTSSISRSPSTLSALSAASSSLRAASSSSPRGSESSLSPRGVGETSYASNRHLVSTRVGNDRTLSVADKELLRCVGLDAYVMIRFLRFGFDVTFYPFLLGCAVLFPAYYTNDYEGEVATDDAEEIVTSGYFRLTITRLEPGSMRLWIAWGYSIVFFVYVLRRLWVEWEVFIALRFDFLANGDVELDPDQGLTDAKSERDSARMRRKRLLQSKAPKDDVQLHLSQYRNSILVEDIPESHRRDKELFEFFDAVFPGAVRRAEILLNANRLTQLIAERQRYIELYENAYAKHFHEKQKFRQKMQMHNEGDVGFCQYLCCCCHGTAPKQPSDPRVKIGGSRFFFCCGKRMVKALPHYLSEIKRLNKAVEMEHRKIMEEKDKSEDREYSYNVLTSNLAQGLKFVTGNGDDLLTTVGFVEFNSLTAKQSALQCNITGTTDLFVTVSAPDPRDIVWDNATVERSVIRLKKMQCDALLFTGTLFWSAVVIAITSVSNIDQLNEYLPGWIIPEEEENAFWYGLITGYVPVVVLELLMLVVIFVLRVIAQKYIRFKTKSERDKWVFRWHFAYRVANLVIIIISGSIYETLNAIRLNPQFFVEQLTSGIVYQSQFFLNNMIVAAGTETFWELAQGPTMIFHFVMHKVITVEAMSKRKLEKLQKAERFEWGEVMPPFIFAFLVGAVYVAIVPLVIGVCAVFFYISTKVYTHQALFVYAQPYEGGGKIMYLLNRTVFIILYIAIIIFSTVLVLKEASLAAPSFFFAMILVTVLVDRRITKTFVRPSVTLALTNSRLIDEETKRIEDRTRRYAEYKAAKLEKRRKAAAAAKAAAMSSTLHDSTKTSAVDSESCAPKTRTIKFNVAKEDGPVQRQAKRHSSRSSQGSRFGRSRGGESDDSDGEEDEDNFYLYRQPQLNKSLWETKPRPYR